MKMTFQEIRIIATGPCIANQLRDVNTICRRSWYAAAHVWKIYDFKIEVVPLIINFSTELTTRRFMRLEPLISHTGILMTFYLSIILDLQNFFH
jgi:polyphosphate kinase 2 (PPK2 family)